MDHSDILISIVIVNYKVPYCLREAICSLREANLYERSEVIVIDNASGDNSRELITTEFPEVQWVQLKTNLGFGKACNLGARHSKGKYLLFLNPDTIVSEKTLSLCVEFMQQHPEAGMLGPKILNPDGTLQASCRRSFPTPSVAFFYFSGLSRFFPNSKKFGQYNLTYMDQNVSAEVDAISGSFMFTNKALFEEIGGFDERFFMYGEDIDLCWRIRQQGFTVWYHPDIQIIHLKGKSSSKRHIRSRIAFYEAMVIFSRKYRAYNGGFFPGWLIFFGIVVQASLNISAILVRTAIAGLIDIFIINITLWAGLTLRFALQHQQGPYGDSLYKMISMHLLITSIFLFLFVYNGVYSRILYSRKNAFLSGILASVISMSAVLSIKVAAFSRIGYGISVLAITVFLVGWREVLPKAIRRLRHMIFAPAKVIIIGNGPLILKLIRNLESQKDKIITGIICCPGNETSATIEGYPVLGLITNLKAILEQNQVDSIIVATKQPWYSHIIRTFSELGRKRTEICWVPQELLEEKQENLPETVPLHSLA